jgi:hypothetical protein
MLRAAVLAALLVLPLCALAKRQQEPECIEKPLNVASPNWYRRTLDPPLSFLRYDGKSPFIRKGAWQQGNNIDLFLQGRGSANPLQDVRSTRVVESMTAAVDAAVGLRDSAL